MIDVAGNYFVIFTMKIIKTVRIVQPKFLYKYMVVKFN